MISNHHSKPSINSWRVGYTLPRMRLAAGLGLAALTLTATLGCGPAQPLPVPPTGGPTRAVFTSLEELTRNSSVVAVVEATATSAVEPDDATVTTVEVVRALRGAARGDQLKVRQLDIAGAPPLVQAGTTYLLFLDTFRWSLAEPTDEYLITGISEQTGPRTYRNLDPEAVLLPATITEAEVVAIIEQTPFAPDLTL